MGEGLAILASLALAITFAAWVFAPIAASRATGGVHRFQLVDVFSLIALWQYPLAFLALVHRLREVQRDVEPLEWALLAVFEVVVTAVWMSLTQTLSQREVYGWLQRFVVIAMAVPMGIVATLCLLGSATATLDRVFSRDWKTLKHPAMIVAGSLGAGVASRLATIRALTPPPIQRVPELPGDNR